MSRMVAKIGTDQDEPPEIIEIGCEVCGYSAAMKIRINETESIRLCDTCSHEALHGRIPSR